MFLNFIDRFKAEYISVWIKQTGSIFVIFIKNNNYNKNSSVVVDKIE